MRIQTLMTKRYRLSFTHTLAADFVLSGKSNLHGHDAYIDVTWRFENRADNKPACSIHLVDRLMQEHVLTPLRDRHLNDIIKHGTGECLGQHIFDSLLKTDLGPHLHGVLVVETRKNRFNIEKI